MRIETDSTVTMAPTNIERAREVYASGYRPDANAVGTFDWKILDGLPKKRLTILSVGGGDGADLWHEAQNHDITVVDDSDSAIASARVHGLAALKCDLSSGLPFDDSSFDVVVAKDILEHLVSPSHLLQEIHRVLNRNGILVVSVPNHFFLTFRLRILFGANLLWKSAFFDHSRSFNEWDYMHIRFFTYRGFERFLGAFGFVPIRRFWDFGVLAHYSEPIAFDMHMREKYRARALTRKARMYFFVLRPLIRLVSFFFPRSVRSVIVGAAPGLLCAGFYYHCKKIN